MGEVGEVGVVGGVGDVRWIEKGKIWGWMGSKVEYWVRLWG